MGTWKNLRLTCGNPDVIQALCPEVADSFPPQTQGQSEGDEGRGQAHVSQLNTPIQLFHIYHSLCISFFTVLLFNTHCYAFTMCLLFSFWLFDVKIKRTASIHLLFFSYYSFCIFFITFYCYTLCTILPSSIRSFSL